MEPTYIKFQKFIKSTQYGYTADETSTESGDCKYLRITDIVPYFVDKDHVPYCKIAEGKKSQYIVSNGDLLIARTGATTGYNLVIDDSFNNFIFASYLIRFNLDKNKLYPLFVKYVLKSKLWYGFVNNYVGGSAQPGMNARVFGKFDFPYLPLPTQRRIASILSTYDALIQNYKRQIAALQSAASELYKEWFVRFRFPGHKNAKFDNGLPEGWNVARIGDFGKVITGKTPPTDKTEYYGKDIMFVKTPDMHGNMFVQQTTEYLSKKGVEYQKAQYIPENSIMVSCIGTYVVTSINAYPANTNQQINSIVLHNKTFLSWLFFAVSDLKETIKMYGNTGTTMTNLSKSKFEKLKLIEPKFSIVQNFEKIITPIFDQIKKANLQITNLTTQRDLLLPRLMSGKLSVE